MAGGLTDAQMAAMQAVEVAYMPDVCDILRPANTTNTAGGTSKANPAVVYAALPCQATARVLRQLVEHVVGGKEESAVRWTVLLPAGTVVLLDDQIQVTEHGSGAVYMLEVNGLLSPESWETAVGVECLRTG